MKDEELHEALRDIQARLKKLEKRPPYAPFVTFAVVIMFIVFLFNGCNFT